jgi:hypothetical protein
VTTCKIPLGRSGAYVAIVDADDYAYLTQWLWSYKISRGGKVYARRHRRVNGVRETVLMHNVILLERKREPRPSDKHTGDHRSRDSLDNRRTNLRWATASQQNKNRVVRKRMLTVCDIADNIPF